MEETTAVELESAKKQENHFQNFEQKPATFPGTALDTVAWVEYK